MSTNGEQSIGRQIEQVTASEMDGKYLTFFTDNQLFGVSIADVVQIVGMQGITEIPEFPHYAKGIINLRGAIIPVIDMRLRLGKLEAEYNERTCIIVTNINERYIGLIVDQVDEVADIANDLIAPPPTVSGTGESYLTGIGKLTNKVVLLMDARKLLGNEQLACFDTTNID
ncbi:MAG: chemotaxis protein CheW [Angelakisella sp.]